MVARVESIFFKPIFPKIDTNAALKAERSAKNIHIVMVLFYLRKALDTIDFELQKCE